MDSIQALKNQILDLESQLSELRKSLKEEEDRVRLENLQSEAKSSPEEWKWPLRPHEYDRYARQLILPQVGLQGQLRLRNASVLIVGVGGLGCPAAAYLAGAGVGTIGLVDDDMVESSNLHRQIAHSTDRVGMSKVESAICYLKGLNPTIKFNPHVTTLTPENSPSIVNQYDMVLDCTDHPASRYLVSDVCVLLGKPFVFAAALQTAGQLMVFNYPPRPPGDREGAPCYRCAFPRPPPAETVVGCGEGGILGPVVGTMGILQALEALKILTAETPTKPPTPTMLLFSAFSPNPFRTVRMASRKPKCIACGNPETSSTPALSLKSLAGGGIEYDYIRFCGSATSHNILREEERISASEYNSRRTEPHVLLDVRERPHFEVCSLDGAVNVPLSAFTNVTHTPAASTPDNDATGKDLPSWWPVGVPSSSPVYVICRQGIDSQVVVRKLAELGLGAGEEDGVRVQDIRGGMRAWRDEVDPSLPFI